jgi:hypothetical protein
LQLLIQNISLSLFPKKWAEGSNGGRTTTTTLQTTLAKLVAKFAAGVVDTGDKFARRCR